jgi:hypothetical protein
VPWINAHWIPIVSVLIIAASSLVNRFTVPHQEDNRWVKALKAVIDMLSIVVHEGKVGLAGPVTLPGVPSLEPSHRDMVDAATRRFPKE